MADLGFNYRLPGNRYIQPPQDQSFDSPETQSSSIYGPVGNQLAQRDQLLSDYYETYGALDSYAKEMARQGVDVFAPDFTQEGGGQAHRAALMLQASVMKAANALKNEYEAEKELRPMIAQGKLRMKPGVDTSGNYYSDLNNFYPTDPTEGVQAANRLALEDTFDQGSQNRVNSRIQEEVNKIDHLVSIGQISPQEGELQKSYIVRNSYKIAPSTINDYNRGGKGGFEIDLLRKYTNLSQGVWNPGTYKDAIRGGKYVLINEDGKGDVLGKYQSGADKNGTPILKDKVVKNWVMDPQTRQVYIEYTDPAIPPDLVSNKSGDAVTRDFISNNSKYGSVNKFMEAARAYGALDETGSVINPTLMPRDYQQRVSDIQSQSKDKSGRVDAKFNEIKQEMLGLKDPWFLNTTKTYSLPDGRNVVVGKHRGSTTFYIDNPEDFPELGGNPENLATDDLISVLGKLGIFNNILNQPTPSPSMQELMNQLDKATPIVNKGGKKAY